MWMVRWALTVATLCTAIQDNTGSLVRKATVEVLALAVYKAFEVYLDRTVKVSVFLDPKATLGRQVRPVAEAATVHRVSMVPPVQLETPVWPVNLVNLVRQGFRVIVEKTVHAAHPVFPAILV